MEYKIIVGSSPLDLEIQVNDLLKNGWELHGSMGSSVLSFSFSNENFPEYYQPMIRKPPKVIKNHATPKFSTTSKAF